MNDTIAKQDASRRLRNPGYMWGHPALGTKRIRRSRGETVQLLALHVHGAGEAELLLLDVAAGETLHCQGWTVAGVPRG